MSSGATDRNGRALSAAVSQSDRLNRGGVREQSLISYSPPTSPRLPEEGRDRRVLLDLLRCVTRSGESLGWEEHLQFHRAIRDLLVISRWHAESCVEVFALRSDDPLRTLDGEEHGEQWRSVVVSDDERASQPSGYRPHLICYEELQETGILQWLALRDKFARALDPVISSIELRGTTANTLLAQTGPGLEALGYLLMLRDGVAEKIAARATLQARFDRILEDLGDTLQHDRSVQRTEARESSTTGCGRRSQRMARERDGRSCMGGGGARRTVRRSKGALGSGPPALTVPKEGVGQIPRSIRGEGSKSLFATAIDVSP